VFGVVSSAVAGIVRWSGLALLVRQTIARRRVSILLYHDPSPEVLDRHLRYLAKRYSFVRLSELVEAITLDRWADLPPRGLVLTFDDGHRGNAELVDLFVRYAVKPTIYVCSQIVGTNRHFWFLESDDPEPLKELSNRERLAALENGGFFPTKEYPKPHALDTYEIERMKDVVDFAAHTRFHPVLTTCSGAEAAVEIESSKAEIEGLIQGPCLDFSYPNGDYGERELALVQGAGYRSGRTVDLGWNDAGTDPFRLKILGTSDVASINRLAADLAAVSGYLARLKVGSFTGRHRPVVRSGGSQGGIATPPTRR
jgi:peptidoglycan/xylan/chitin deacetylase (PgdA/CDA1 family)